MIGKESIRFRALSVIFIFSLISCKNTGTSSSSWQVPSFQPNKTRSDILKLVTGNTYYLDSKDGSDNNNGGPSDPWQTIAKARMNVHGGDCAILRSGSYGEYFETDNSGRESLAVYINEEGATPVFSTINLHYYEPTDANLVFYGISVEVEAVDPGYPAYYSGATQDTFHKTKIPLDLQYAQRVDVNRCILKGTDKGLTPYGVRALMEFNNVIIENCEIFNVGQGITYRGGTCENVIIRNNYIHNIARSGITEGAYTYGNRLIEGNTVYDAYNNYGSEAEGGDPYLPRSGDPYHGSSLGLRGGNIVIRNNVWHYGWSSCGLEFITDGLHKGEVFKNIMIENNLMYDIGTYTLIQVGCLGDNVTVRNNTFVSFLRNDPKGYGANKYTTSLWLHSVADGYDGSGLILENNIFAGKVSLLNGSRKGDWTESVIENNNIYWALQDDYAGNKWKNPADLVAEKSTSQVITWSAANGSPEPVFFDTGFFVDDIVFDKNHGKTFNFDVQDSVNVTAGWRSVKNE